MKKKKNKFLMITLIILSILSLLGMFYAFNFKISQRSIPISPTEYILANLSSEDNKSAIYTFKWISSGSSGLVDCSEETQYDLDFTPPLTYRNSNEIPIFVLGLKEDTYFNANIHSYSGLDVVINPCSDRTTTGSYIDNTIARCKIKNLGISNGINRAELICNFKGVIQPRDSLENTVSAGIGKLTEAYAEVEILKEGTECTKDYHCSENKLCKNNICTVNDCTETPTDYYLFEENQCKKMTNSNTCIPQEGYRTLEECSENITNSGISLFKIVILAISILIISIFIIVLIVKIGYKINR